MHIEVFWVSYCLLPATLWS